MPGRPQFPLLVRSEAEAGPAVIAAVQRVMDDHLQAAVRASEAADTELDAPASYARVEAEIRRCLESGGR